MRNKCVTGCTSVPSIECKRKKRRQLYWRAGQGLGSICRQAGCSWRSSGAFTQRHLPRKGEELNSGHLVQNPACFPLRLPGPKLPMTPLRGAKYGLPSQGILAAAVRSSLWWRCTLAQRKHLDALHGSIERKFSPFCWHKWTTVFEKCSSEHCWSWFPLNKGMCLECCQKAWRCVNCRLCCCWNDQDLTDDTWPQRQLGESVSMQYEGLEREGERERERGKRRWGRKKDRETETEGGR